MNIFSKYIEKANEEQTKTITKWEFVELEKQLKKQIRKHKKKMNKLNIRKHQLENNIEKQ